MRRHGGCQWQPDGRSQPGRADGQPGLLPWRSMRAASLSTAATHTYLDESAVGIDLNGDGDTTDVIDTDQIGNQRACRHGYPDMGAVESDFPVVLVVDRTDDLDIEACTSAPNDCTLRGAMNLANAISGADTITFDPTVFATPQTILLTDYLPGIDEDVTITGPGAALATVDGDNTYQPFFICGCSTVSISGLTITHGLGDPFDGGGAIDNYGDLTISDSLITDNHADEIPDIASPPGGGIANYGTLQVLNTTISNNSASVGGGIYNYTDATIINSIISGNSAAGSEGGIGGGIFDDGDTMQVINSTVSNNSASDGGGIASDYGPLTIRSSTIANNTSDYEGGGIDSGADLLVVDSTFSGNSTAFYGGGIESYNGTSTIINSTIASNSTTQISGEGDGGGGTDFYGGGDVLIINSTIAGNSAITPNEGTSGIWLESGALTIQNTIVANNGTGADNCQLESGTSLNDTSSNLDNGTSCGFGGAVGQNTNPLLDPGGLANNGGPTETIAIAVNSPAINAGNDALAVDENGNSLQYDQRGSGYPRINGLAVDIGAYEHDGSGIPAQLVFTQQPTDTIINHTITPAVTVEIEDSNGVVVTSATNNITLALTIPGGATLNGTTTVSAVSGVATFSDLSVDTVGTSYTLDASASGLPTATSSAFNITIPILISRTLPSLVVTDDANLVTEGASIGDRFAFELTQAPSADVTVTFSSTDPSQLQIIDFTVIGRYQPENTYTVTFSASGASGAHMVPWNTPVVTNLYGVPDAVAEGAQTYGIHFTLTSGDPVYNNLTVPDEPVTVYDAGVTNNPTSLTLPEGGSGNYTIVLNGPPGFMALTTALGGNRDEHVTVTVDGVDYTFTRSNWNVPQTVTVSAPAPDGLCGNYNTSVPEAVTSDIGTNPYMDSSYGGPTSPAANVSAPDEVIHVTDTDCGGTAPLNRAAPPALNGSAPSAQPSAGQSTNSTSNSEPPPVATPGDLPPSIEGPGG